MDKVKDIINEWDPMNLFPHAPEDEYSIEIKRINIILKDETELTVEELSERLEELFQSSFGNESFRSSRHFDEECMAVAIDLKCISEKYSL